MEVIRLLEVVKGIVGGRKCEQAKLAVQLRERYRRLIPRERVASTFTPRSSTQAACATKTEQGAMIIFLQYFALGEKRNSSRRVILKIQLEVNNLNSILSRSAVTPVFPHM